MKQEELPFEFSGKVARLLGRESVSSEVAALFELIKNAYDADATAVTVSFRNFSKNVKAEPMIVIEDDGIGMNLQELKENWMVIGTYSKDKIHKTKSGRRVVGNKGIGRFATERLAGKSILETKSTGNSEQITLEVNWSRYEKENVTFNDVFHTVYINPDFQNKNYHGTKITLSELRDTWTKEKVSRLRQAVSSIVLPPQISQTIGDKFEVIIDDPDFGTSEEKKVQSTLLELAPFKVTSILSKDRNNFVVHVYKFNKEVNSEPKDLSEKPLEAGSTWKHFGRCKFTLYFYPGESKLEKWNIYYRKALKISKITDLLKEIHGVKIYRDGFLVRPYGEKGNDWLNLEKERVMHNLWVGNTQVIGFVEISSDDNGSILDTTTRERLVENEYFESMRMFLKESISVLNDYREKDSEKRKEAATKTFHANVLDSEIKDLEKFISEMEGLEPEDKSVIKQSLRNITKTFQNYKDEIEIDTGDAEKRKRMYRNLATLGISSAGSAHDINNILAVMGEIPKSIGKKIKKDKIDIDGIFSDAKELSEYIVTINQFLQFIRQFVLNLKEDFESNHEKEKIHISSTLESLLKKFTSLFIDTNIEIKLAVYPEDLTVYINKADLYSIIVNLLTNSIKAIDLLPRKENKVIKITVEKQAYSLKMLFSNNGPNIPERHLEKIFELFISRYKEGTGLGLPITREIIEEYDGTIEAKSKPEFERGATFEIKIPLEKLKK